MSKSVQAPCGLNSRCPHCYKLYRVREPWESEDWNYCPKGHRTLYLESIDRDRVQQNLIDDYRSWIPYYKRHHHRIRRILDDRRKVFLKVLHRDQENLFALFPHDIDKMIRTAFEVGDREHRELKSVKE